MKLPLQACLVMLVCWAGVATGQGQPGTCGPSALGAPCALEGPATLPTHQGPALGLGNPVHLRTGHKYQRDTDALAGPGGLALEVVRHYNNTDPRDVGLGPGWRLSYDTRVYRVGEGWQVVQADGSRWVFHAPAAPGLPCQPDQPLAQGQFYVLPAGGYRWRWPGGRELQFDAAGRLQQIDDPQLGQVRMGWVRLPGRTQPDRLSWVQDPAGRVLHLHYRQGRLQAAVLPFGAVRYRYSTGGQLRAALAPSGEGRVYVYEPQAQVMGSGSGRTSAGAALPALSGVLALHGGQVRRLWAWDYNAKGQVVQVHAGERGLGRRVTLQYGAREPGGNGASAVLAKVTVASPNKAVPVRKQASVAVADGRLLGWPGLRVAPDGSNTWFTPPTGWQHRTGPGGRAAPGLVPGSLASESVAADVVSAPWLWQFANGDRWVFSLDAEQRLAAWHRHSAGQQDTVTLTYPGVGEVLVHHAHEIRHHRHRPDDKRPGLQRVDSWLRRPALAGMPAWDARETVWRNATGQVVRHALPEGGELHYTWHESGALQAIVWLAAQGGSTILYQQNGGVQQLANGLTVQGWQQTGQQWHVAAWGRQPVLAQQRLLDHHGRVVQERLRVAGAPAVHRQLQYDAQGRLVAMRDAYGSQFMAWDAAGGRRDLPGLPRDASGLPLAWQGWALHYGPDRRLVRASRGEQEVNYVYNASGDLIARVAGAQARQYLYSGHQRVAEWQPLPQGGGRVVHRYVYAGEVPVALLRWRGGAPWSAGSRYEVITVHADALGQPVALSDASRRILWRGSFDVWGGLQAEQGRGDPGWRLPGQWVDPLPGWHLNHQRVYLPQAGQYLEPEPLGPPAVSPGRGMATSLWGYAAQQPRRWLDPTGLVLFAFDGTLQNLQAQGNVVQFAAAYRDLQAAAAGLAATYYRPGPGTEGWLDAALAGSAMQIVQGQWQSLLQHLMGMAPGNDPVVIDLIGYSRGAALARHFGNLVANEVRQGRFWAWDNQLGAITQCVDLRFMGLFDSVAQFGVLGSHDDQFNFTLNPAWRGAAHAVALHERRDWFPLLSLQNPAGELPAGVTEQGFVGSHGDVGGGWLTRLSLAPGEVPLSDISLEWMLQQAEALGVAVEQGKPLAAGHWATLHDDRTPYQRLQGWYADQAQGQPVPGVSPVDRAVLHAGAQALVPYQGLHATLGATSRQATEAFIRRAANWLHHPDVQVAHVDLSAYQRWLAGLP